VKPKQPEGVLIDYGGTLVEEVSYDPRAGNEWLLAKAVSRRADLTIDQVLDRAAKVTNDVAARRDEFQIETPWPMLIRLIHDFFGTGFSGSTVDLELGFWKASVKTHAMPGAVDVLKELHERRIPTGVVSNCSFGPHVIRYELEKHGLAEHFQFVMVSAEYAVRKPNVLLFDTAAAKLGMKPQDIWFIGDRWEIDIAGAKAAGMTPVWFHAPRVEYVDQVLCVRDWTDLLAYL
jgi:putative hydrolase of the HAD superfamily